MTGESMAQAATRGYLPVGDEDYVEDLNRNAAEGAGSNGRRWRQAFPELFGRSLPLVVGKAVAELTVAFTALGKADRLPQLVVFPTRSHEVSAHYEPKADNTGLVVLSDSLFILCSIYCRQLGQATFDISNTTSFAKLGLRMIIAQIKGTLGGDPARLAVLLRHHHINRRAHGMATAVATRRDVRDRDSLSHQDFSDLHLMPAIRFFLGHEMAHHVLGHQTECAQSPEQETQADLLALQAGALAYASDVKTSVTPDRYVREQWLDDAGEFYALVASVIAMLAVQSLEDALMIRRGRTHLPARDRASSLIDLLLGDDRIRKHESAIGRRDKSFRKRIDSERVGLEALTRSLMVATEKAADFGESPYGFNWTGLPAAEVVMSGGMGLTESSRLDRLLSQTSEELAAALVHSPLSVGALHARLGDTRRAMREWGIPETVIDNAHNRNVGLAYYTIVDYLRDAGHEQGRTGVELSDHPLIAATLTARQLPGS
ncbi:hypothetical protein [Streptomyces sp. NBC_01565]|uniref:hypothetical protein n=1 Tax=Streptomyces sp. NBC_01565 TaxID=2975881 RepID=UPI0022527D5C|nr:hypothetical protein [Streptomyces sp. NBC_01565]MCX4546937.1 hypothetical protein [Streptomyces sp. NBC_01565]